MKNYFVCLFIIILFSCHEGKLLTEKERDYKAAGEGSELVIRRERDQEGEKENPLAGAEFLKNTFKYSGTEFIPHFSLVYKQIGENLYHDHDPAFNFFNEFTYQAVYNRVRNYNIDSINTYLKIKNLSTSIKHYLEAATQSRDYLLGKIAESDLASFLEKAKKRKNNLNSADHPGYVSEATWLTYAAPKLIELAINAIKKAKEVTIPKDEISSFMQMHVAPYKELFDKTVELCRLQLEALKEAEPLAAQNARAQNLLDLATRYLLRSTGIDSEDDEAISMEVQLTQDRKTQINAEIESRKRGIRTILTQLESQIESQASSFISENLRGYSMLLIKSKIDQLEALADKP